MTAALIVDNSDTALRAGRVLQTRDGRKIGNAVIVGVSQHDQLGEVYDCETDFGNKLCLTAEEIDELFHVGPLQDLERRGRDQAALSAGPQVGAPDVLRRREVLRLHGDHTRVATFIDCTAGTLQAIEELKGAFKRRDCALREAVTEAFRRTPLPEPYQGLAASVHAAVKRHTQPIYSTHA